MFFIVVDVFNVFHWFLVLFIFPKKKLSAFLFICMVFQIFLIAGVSIRVVTVSSVVGAPWRCRCPDDIGR